MLETAKNFLKPFAKINVTLYIETQVCTVFECVARKTKTRINYVWIINYHMSGSCVCIFLVAKNIPKVSLNCEYSRK